MEIALGFMGGLVIGLILGYLFLYRPLLALYHSMRLQGFVPQFEIRQKIEHDPSREVRER